MNDTTTTTPATTDAGAAGAAATGAAANTATTTAAASTTADKGSTPLVGAAAGAAANAAATATATAADATTTATATPAAWADNWRDVLAEQAKPGDTKFRERLNRFGSPSEITKSWLAAEAKLSSGEYKPVSVYPDKGTPEQQAAWRKDNNVPDKPEAYEVKLGNGMVVGEADKPVIEQFAKAVHGKNWSQQQFNDAVSTYYEIQDAQAAQIKAADDEYRGTTEEALRAEWGGDYKPYTNAIDNFLGSLPDEVGALLANGRLADGRRIGADARVIKALKDIVFDLNPAASLLPAGAQRNGGADRLAEIRKMRQEDPNKYDNDKAIQAEELKLLDAQLVMNRRGTRAA